MQGGYKLAWKLTLDEPVDMDGTRGATRDHQRPVFTGGGTLSGRIVSLLEASKRTPRLGITYAHMIVPAAPQYICRTTVAKQKGLTGAQSMHFTSPADEDTVDSIRHRPVPQHLTGTVWLRKERFHITTLNTRCVWPLKQPFWRLTKTAHDVPLG